MLADRPSIQADHQLQLFAAEPTQPRRACPRPKRTRCPARPQLTLPNLVPVARNDNRKRGAKLSADLRRDAAVLVEADFTDHAAYVAYRNARALQGTFNPKDGVPIERAACPPDRYENGCCYVKCRWHLWRLDGGIDGNRAGRPGLATLRRNKRGLTESVPGELQSAERAGTTLIPRWLEGGAVAPSCTLDEIAKHGKMSNQQAGHALGRHRTLVAREARGAGEKAVDTAEEMGMSRDDFMQALTRMGDR